MRPRRIEHEALPESESEALSLSPSPLPRIRANLSSMVVKPSLSGGAGSDIDVRYTADSRLQDSPPRYLRRNSPQNPHHRDSSASIRRFVGSSTLPREGSTDFFRRPVTRPAVHSGGSPMGLHLRGSPTAFHGRAQRLQNGPGYIQRSGSISPLRRPRVDENYYEQDFGHPRDAGSGRGMRGRGGRSRDGLPLLGRGGRPYARGSNSSARAVLPIEEEYVHRNDPNLSPREGDWICQNPHCGNLNFARRTSCNNCHKFRYDEPYDSSHSPRRGYASPLHRDLSQRTPVSPINRGPRRDFNGYRSPPPWGIDEPKSIIPSRRGGKSFDPIRRESLEFRRDNFRGRGRGRGRSNWHVNGDAEPRYRDVFSSSNRGVNRRPLSPHDRSIQDARGRSRSPAGRRSPLDSFVGRGRDFCRYDGPYVGTRKAGDLDSSRGRGYRSGVAQVRSPDFY